MNNRPGETGRVRRAEGTRTGERIGAEDEAGEEGIRCDEAPPRGFLFLSHLPGYRVDSTGYVRSNPLDTEET